MRRLLKEISVIPGVSGTCIFDKNEGVLCAELGAELPKNLTEQMGIHFVRVMRMGAVNKLRIKSAHFYFDRYAVIGLPLEQGEIVLVVCDSQVNCSLMATTVAMLIEDLGDELTKPVSPRKEQEKGPGRPAPVSPARHEINDELRPLLGEVEEALARAIGPVAGMVLADYLDMWREDGPAAAVRLPELIAMLTGEIDNAGLAQEFKFQLKHLL